MLKWSLLSSFSAFLFASAWMAWNLDPLFGLLDAALVGFGLFFLAVAILGPPEGVVAKAFLVPATALAIVFGLMTWRWLGSLLLAATLAVVLEVIFVLQARSVTKPPDTEALRGLFSEDDTDDKDLHQ